MFVKIIDSIYIENWNPPCEATAFASKIWPFKGMVSQRGYKSIHFCLDLHCQFASCLSREAGLSSGWLLKRGSIV